MLTVRNGDSGGNIANILDTISTFVHSRKYSNKLDMGRTSERISHPSRMGYSVPFKVSTLEIFIVADWCLCLEISV